MKIIRADRRAPASIMRALRRNEGLALLIDQPTPEGGVAVTFFGATIAVPEGTARLALRTGARIVSVALARPAAGSDRWVALADLDIRPERTGDLERDVQALTQRIFSGYERFIRAYPDQWYIFPPALAASPLARGEALKKRARRGPLLALPLVRPSRSVVARAGRLPAGRPAGRAGLPPERPGAAHRPREHAPRARPRRDAGDGGPGGAGAASGPPSPTSISPAPRSWTRPSSATIGCT
ncbi:MAG: lysophospholipid acyltransferase family protein [Dehalococcoidia bacterium]